MAALKHIRSTNIADAVKEVPSRAREFLRSSFSSLITLPKEKWGILLDVAVDVFDADIDDGGDANLVATLGISKEEAKSQLNAASFAAAMLAAHPEATSVDFVEAIQNVGIIEGEAAKEWALEFASFVAGRRDALVEEFERNTIKNEVLPSLSRFESTVDVRFSFSETNEIRAVPLGLIMIDTDAEGQIIWFQVSKGQIRKMISHLESTLTQIEKAESWISGKREN